MEDEVFQQVTDPERLRELVRALRNDLPHSASMNNCLMMEILGYVSYHEFYELRTAGPNPVILVRRQKRHRGMSAISLYCRESDVPILMEAVKKTQLIDWTKPFFFIHIPSFMEEGIRSLLQSFTQGKNEVIPVTSFLFVQREEAQEEIRCPAQVRVCYLGETGVRQLHKTWLYNKHVSLSTLLSMSQYPTGIGAYEAKDNKELVVRTESLERAGDQEKAMAWVTFTPFGVTGMLHTLENHRRRGLGRLVMRTFTRVQDEKGFIPLAFVEDGNENSLKLFTGLPGWRNVDPKLLVAVNCTFK